MRVAVIADTHGLLRQETVDLIGGCDAVIHAGDVDTPDIYEKLKGQKPFIWCGGTMTAAGPGSCRNRCGLNWRAFPFF